MVAAALLATLLSATPDAGAVADDGLIAPRQVEKLDAREALWDTVEAFVDEAMCGPLKKGVHRLPESVAAPGAQPDVADFVTLSSCSLRALEFFPEKDGARALMLFEVDGIDRAGLRRTRRGEARTQLQRHGDSWRVTRFEPAWSQTVTRPRARFVPVSREESGLAVPDPKEQIDWREFDIMRGGLGAFDLDGDGLLEVLVTGADRARLFHNLGGLRFEALPFSLRAPKGTALSAPAIADFDDDGDKDVLISVAARGASRLFVFRNDDGKLVRRRDVRIKGWITGLVPWDANGDGHLDVAAIRYGRTTFEPDVYLEATNGFPMMLMQGNGKLGFKVSTPKGTRARWGLAAVASALGGHAGGLYVANDYGSNDLWTLEKGRFVNHAVKAGLDDPGNGMSADVGDVNGDGRLDLYVANMFSKAGTRVLRSTRLKGTLGEALVKFASGNTLYVAQPDGSYVEQAKALGVNRGLWAFGSMFFDADDDGRLDLAVANGFLSNTRRKDL